jgi:hypothetical protein
LTRIGGLADRDQATRLQVCRLIRVGGAEPTEGQGKIHGPAKNSRKRDCRSGDAEHLGFLLFDLFHQAKRFAHALDEP